MVKVEAKSLRRNKMAEKVEKVVDKPAPTPEPVKPVVQQVIAGSNQAGILPPSVAGTCQDPNRK